MKARVTVTLKAGVLDPQGQAIENALASLGIEGVKALRQGKVFDIILEKSDEAQAREKLQLICEKLLTNLVIENYQIDLVSP